jgi:hypothetical protein
MSTLSAISFPDSLKMSIMPMSMPMSMPAEIMSLITKNDELNNERFMVRYKACLWHPMYIKIIKKIVSDSEIVEFMNVLKIINRFREELNKRTSDVHRDIENGSPDNQVYGITMSNVHHNEEESWWWVDITDKSSWWITEDESELLYKYGWSVSYDK